MRVPTDALRYVPGQRVYKTLAGEVALILGKGWLSPVCNKNISRRISVGKCGNPGGIPTRHFAFHHRILFIAENEAETRIRAKCLPKGLIQKWSWNSGSRTVIGPATPSLKPSFARSGNADASRCYGVAVLLRWSQKCGRIRRLRDLYFGWKVVDAIGNRTM